MDVLNGTRLSNFTLGVRIKKGEAKQTEQIGFVNKATSKFVLSSKCELLTARNYNIIIQGFYSFFRSWYISTNSVSSVPAIWDFFTYQKYCSDNTHNTPNFSTRLPSL